MTLDRVPAALKLLLWVYLRELSITKFLFLLLEQDDTSEYDQQWLKKFGVQVIRDRSKILLPSLRVATRAKEIAQIA
jgi:hypothetical protein